MPTKKGKVAELKESNKDLADAVEYLSELVAPAIAALKYIASEDPEGTGIVLLNKSDRRKQDPQEVAMECLQVMANIKQSFGQVAGKKDTPERVTLGEAGEIRLTDAFDILYHQCCDCGLIHEVSLEWMGDRDVITRWSRKDKDSLPTEADVTEAGHTVIRKEDLQ